MGSLCGEWAEFCAVRISDRLLALALRLANWVELRQSRRRSRQRTAARADL